MRDIVYNIKTKQTKKISMNDLKKKERKKIKEDCAKNM